MISSHLWKRQFIAVSWDCFCQYITIKFGAVHDRYIILYVSDVNDVRLLQSFVIDPDKNTEQTSPLSCSDDYSQLWFERVVICAS